MALFSKSNSVKILNEIEKELEEIIYGSIEIYVHDREVTQISVRKIQKTNLSIKEKNKQKKPQNSHLSSSLQTKQDEFETKTDIKVGLDK